ncbi:ATP-binding cassette domain-containing protein [bacterium]|nr:ATP-binding cassette domain-containing protein [bacterium]
MLVDSFQQLWPLVRPHRWALASAVSCAVLAAGLWACGLLLTFPVTKILLEQQSLRRYIAEQIADARANAEWESQVLKTVDQEIAEQESAGQTEGSDYVELLRKRSRVQRNLSQAHRQEWWYSLGEFTLSPWLPKDRFDELALLLGGLLVVTLGHGLTVYLQEVWVGRVVQLSMRSLRSKLFRHTLKLDVQTLGVDGTPTLMSRFTNDLNAIAQGMTLIGGKIVLEPLKAAACLGWAFALNWRLTLLSLVCAPLGALLFASLGRKLKKASRRQMETVARIYQVLQETLSSFRLVTAFQQQRHHRLRLYRENRQYFRKSLQINRLDALVNPTVELLGVTAACLAILPGAYLVLRQKTTILGVQLTSLEMDLAALALLYSLLGGVLDPARKLSSVFSKLKKSVAACERVNDWLDRHSQLSTTDDDLVTVPHRESLELRHVTYRYHGPQTAPPVLDDISLRIPFGETVAIVGGNGSGKSTLAGLWPRFYDPVAGTVFIDGVDVSTLPIRALRQQIGWVPQDPMLFDRSIAANIAVGVPQATPAEIESVARRAYVWDFVSAWPQGLETPIGDAGHRLSGGQRQRIALARAMLRDPALMILDEATSAVDAQSELLIYRALSEFCCGRTTLIITHSLTPALLEFIDRVIVLERGRVIACGTHAELLECSPPYRALFTAQTVRRAA